MKSPYWDNTAIIINWDDFGGFFDTIVSPVFDGFQLGYRIPALIISAYPSSPGYIDNTVYSFESTLKFIEYTFHLPPLDSRDSMANNLLDAFNFNQLPQRPYVINLTSTEIAALSKYQSISAETTPDSGGTGLSPELNESNNFGLALIDSDED